ncbi:MAG: DUF1254 domain-containing protein [Nitratireductor sp.]|nr:DUF1254 domain-containing protein [Nitratireductor sp.]
MNWRMIYLATVGLVLAGIVHIAIVLLIPQYGTRGAWAFLSGRTDLYAFSPLKAEETGSAISEVDPFFTYGICRFDLREAGLRMAGPEVSSFWSASVFDESGAVVYSLNNRTAIDNKLDIMVISPLQGLEMREAQIDQLEAAVIIEASIEKGFVIIRVFEPDSSWAEENERFLREIDCKPFLIGS